MADEIKGFSSEDKEELGELYSPVQKLIREQLGKAGLDEFNSRLDQLTTKTDKLDSALLNTGDFNAISAMKLTDSWAEIKDKAVPYSGGKTVEQMVELASNSKDQGLASDILSFINSSKVSDKDKPEGDIVPSGSDKAEVDTDGKPNVTEEVFKERADALLQKRLNGDIDDAQYEEQLGKLELSLE